MPGAAPGLSYRGYELPNLVMNLEDQGGPGADKAVGALQAKGQTGLVTLLFTDIVASTALKQQLGDKAAVELLERHQ